MLKYYSGRMPQIFNKSQLTSTPWLGPGKCLGGPWECCCAVGCCSPLGMPGEGPWMAGCAVGCCRPLGVPGMSLGVLLGWLWECCRPLGMPGEGPWMAGCAVGCCRPLGVLPLGVLLYCRLL